MLNERCDTGCTARALVALANDLGNPLYLCGHHYNNYRLLPKFNFNVVHDYREPGQQHEVKVETPEKVRELVTLPDDDQPPQSGGVGVLDE